MKKMLLVALITGLMGSGIAGAGVDTITLKAEACVKGPQIKLGEVADISGPHRDKLSALELSAAAPPGDSRRIERIVVETKLKVAGFGAKDVQLDGASAVTTKTLRMDVTQDVIEQNLRAFIEHEMPWKAEEAVVEVTLPPGELVVSDGELGFEWKLDPGFRFIGTGNVRGAVTVDGQVKRSFPCKVSIEAYNTVAVASGPIERGSLLTASNVTLERRALSGLKDVTFTNPAEYEGMVARRAIASGDVITRRNLAPPVVVKRNQIVTVETKGGELQIETQARAMSDGAVGDAIVCVNPNSNQPFQGIVRKDGVVVVE